MTKTGLFFISDYRDVTCKPGREPSYWILKGLDRDNRFEVYSTPLFKLVEWVFVVGAIDDVRGNAYCATTLFILE
ncbi:MAG: hypothetical protein WBD09_11030 [Halobacteriota archaeon]